MALGGIEQERCLLIDSLSYLYTLLKQQRKNEVSLVSKRPWDRTMIPCYFFRSVIIDHSKWRFSNHAVLWFDFKPTLSFVVLLLDLRLTFDLWRLVVKACSRSSLKFRKRRTALLEKGRKTHLLLLFNFTLCRSSLLPAWWHRHVKLLVLQVTLFLVSLERKPRSESVPTPAQEVSFSHNLLDLNLSPMYTWSVSSYSCFSVLYFTTDVAFECRFWLIT